MLGFGDYIFLEHSRYEGPGCNFKGPRQGSRFHAKVCFINAKISHSQMLPDAVPLLLLLCHT